MKRQRLTDREFASFLKACKGRHVVVVSVGDVSIGNARVLGIEVTPRNAEDSAIKIADDVTRQLTADGLGATATALDCWSFKVGNRFFYPGWS